MSLDETNDMKRNEKHSEVIRLIDVDTKFKLLHYISRKKASAIINNYLTSEKQLLK